MTTYIKTSAPHITSHRSLAKNYWIKSACLLPLALLAGLIFSWRAFGMIMLSILAGQLAEYCGGLITSRQYQPKLGRSFFLSLLFVLLLPPSTSYAIVFTSSFLAILVASEFLGGPGQSLFHVALVGRLLAGLFLQGADGDIAFAQKSGSLSLSLVLKTHEFLTAKLPAGATAFVGSWGESLAEMSALFVLLCGFLMAWQKLASFRQALLFIFGALVAAVILGNGIWTASLLSPGVLFCAFFVLSESESMPSAKRGKFIFVFLAGFLVSVFARKMPYFEAAALGILGLNLLTGWIDYVTQPRGRRAR